MVMAEDVLRAVDAHEPKYQGVPHRATGSEPRHEVAGRDAIDDAIPHREQEERVRHRLPEWGKHTDCVQHRIGPDGENEDRKHAGEDGADASEDAPRTMRFVHRRAFSAPPAANSSASLS